MRICWNRAFSLRHCTVSSVPEATFSRTASATPFTFSVMVMGSPSPSVTVSGSVNGSFFSPSATPLSPASEVISGGWFTVGKPSLSMYNVSGRVKQGR